MHKKKKTIKKIKPKMKKKVILFVMPRFTTGGAEMLVLQYAIYFSKKYDVHVASTVDGGELEELFNKHPKISLFVGSRKKDGGRMGVYKRLCDYIRAIEPDIVHSHLFGADLVASQAIQCLSKRPIWISTLHNVQHHQSLIRRIVWKRIYRHADFVVSVSKGVFQYAKQEFNLVAPRLIKNLNGIIIKDWIKVSTKSLFTQSRVELATIGRLEIQKGHKYLFTALSYLKDYKWVLNIYGEGSLEDELKRQALELGIHDRIVWHGVDSKLTEKMSLIDIVIQPSLWEGLSLVIMESMAAGRCVVASREAGLELIQNNKTGYLVKKENGVSLSHVLADIFDNKKKAKAVAEAGRKYVKKNFSFDRHVKDLSKLYYDVLE